jgi:enoyl-CoA hydratase/carnithine racemase
MHDPEKRVLVVGKHYAATNVIRFQDFGRLLETDPMLHLSRAGEIAVLTMRHGKANAMDVELCRQVTSQLEELGTSSARALVITGQNQIFSAGVDLLRALDGGASYLRDFLPALRKLFDVMFFFPKPVIAAINGHAIAGGCVLACAADVRFMTKGAGRIGVTELLVGLPFPAIALEIMRFATAPDRFEEVIFTGRTYAAEGAAVLGMIHAATEPEGLLGRALTAAQALAGLAPATFALTKNQSRQPVLDRLQKNGPAQDAAVDEIWLAPESAARMRDYVSRTFKRPADKE